MCTVTETSNGSVVGTDVVVTGAGQQVKIDSGKTETVHIADTYSFVGSLLVRKTIAGPAAGQQGPITIHSECNGTALTPDFTIPAGAPAGDRTMQYDHIPAPATCTVTKTADGRTSTVSVVVTGSGQTVSISPGSAAVIGSPQTATIPPGGAGAAHITDDYGAAPGSLLVTKTIAGDRAGHQGPVIIHVACNGTAMSPNFVIPAGTPAGSFSKGYDGIPAGSVCTVTEIADGSTDTITATVSGNGQKVTVPAGNVVPVNLVDAYELTPVPSPDLPPTTNGFLKVTKTIAGPAAGRQGQIAILVTCGGPGHDYAFLIPAHHHAGSVSRVFAGLPAGSRCAVTETKNGKTGTVSVTASGKRRKATIPANRGVTVHLIDTFVGAQAVSVTG